MGCDPTHCSSGVESSSNDWLSASHRDAAGVEYDGEHHVRVLLDDDGRQAFERLVQQQRVEHQRAAEGERLLLATGERPVTSLPFRLPPPICRLLPIQEIGRLTCALMTGAVVSTGLMSTST